jgi:hypothetical protein
MGFMADNVPPADLEKVLYHIIGSWLIVLSRNQILVFTAYSLRKLLTGFISAALIL